jgi:hypothetical protein
VSAPAAVRAQTASPLAPRRRPTVPPRPRRISGPARSSRPAAAARRAEGGLALGAIALLGRLDALASHRLLDRLIRSRVWIGIVAFALIGIVTLQLGLLRLNSGIGRALEREGYLQRENAALSVENSELASGGRVETEAGKLGMQLFSVAGLKFLGSAHAGDVGKAAAALRAAPAHEAGAAQTETAAAATESSSGSASATTSEGGEAASESAGAHEGAAAQSETGGETPSTGASTGAEATHGEEAPPSSTGSEAGSGTGAGAGGGALAPGG